MTQLFLGIDSGTQGTKAVLVDGDDGRIVANGYASHPIIENESGKREQEPQWWIDACTRAIAQAVNGSGHTFPDVKAIGVSGQQHGMVALDENGSVIRPAKLWCDTETTAQADELTRRLGGCSRVIGLIGNPISVGFTASKIVWLRENEPDNYRRIRSVLLPHDFLNYWLTGQKTTEFGDASGTAYFDIRSRTWSEEVLRAIDRERDLLDALPALIPFHESPGVVRRSLFGERHDILVSAGGGDNMMAAIGTGNVTPGVVTASLGTSGTIYSFSDRPVIDERGELAAFCSSDGNWLPLVCTMNVTVSTELTRKLLRLEVEELNARASAAQIGSGGLMLLPYFNGERTPALPTAKATLYGLNSMNMTAENLCRASMEGATLGLRYGLDVLKRQGIQPTEIRLVGGGSKSRIWRRIAANVLGCPVVCPVTEEAGAYGAALQAMSSYTGASIQSIAKDYVKLDQSTRAEPDPDSMRRYTEIYQNYLKLNDAIKPMYEG